jgi:hypothetical protein
MLACSTSPQSVRQSKSSDGAAQMRTVTNSDTATGESAIDELLERYVSWSEECCTVRLAYQRWDDSARGERALAYAAYLEALDREQHAAGAYAKQVERVRRIST